MDESRDAARAHTIDRLHCVFLVGEKLKTLTRVESVGWFSLALPPFLPPRRYYPRMRNPHWILYDKLCIISNCKHIFLCFMCVSALAARPMGVSEWGPENQKEISKWSTEKKKVSCMKERLEKWRKFQEFFQRATIFIGWRSKKESTRSCGWALARERSVRRHSENLKISSEKKGERREMRSEPENEKCGRGNT